jgi:hypothetical protein
MHCKWEQGVLDSEKSCPWVCSLLLLFSHHTIWDIDLAIDVASAGSESTLAKSLIQRASL